MRIDRLKTLRTFSLKPQQAKSKEPVSSPTEPVDRCDISFGKKIVNATVWGIAGAVVGTAACLAAASLIAGPSALGALVFLPKAAAAGSLIGGLAGFKS